MIQIRLNGKCYNAQLYTETQNTCEFYVHVVHRSLATLQDAILLSHVRHINKQEQVRGQILIRLYYMYLFSQCQGS